MSKITRIIFTATALLYPLVLNSADIYSFSAGKTKIVSITNGHIIQSDPRLSKSLVAVYASTSLSDVKLHSPCLNSSEVVYKKNIDEDHSFVVFDVSFKDSYCENPALFVRSGGKIFTDTKKNFRIDSDSMLLSSYLDMSSDNLVFLSRKETDELKNLSGSIDKSLALTGSTQTVSQKLNLSSDMYHMLFLKKSLELKRDILFKRDGLSYVSPVKYHMLPTKNVLLPGAGRPYRKDTTDGIHHGWDIMAPVGTPVQSITDGIVVRVVSHWAWWDFDRLKKGKLSEDDKLLNLDIFRGKQVWLKTMDGNIVFYSHLSEVGEGIMEGKIVKQGDILGKIGTSGVPEKNYKDVHLHFEIQKNPYTGEAFTPLSVMRWDYLGKGMSGKAVIALQNKFFGESTNVVSHMH